MKSVLFVCTGNTDRSPLAEYAFKELVKDKGNVEVSSAGTDAYPGQPMSDSSRTVLQWKLNIPFEVTDSHKSKLLTNELLDKYDIIVPMTEKHKRIILSKFKVDEGKVHKLLSFVDSNADVDDPFMHPIDAYIKTYDLVYPALIALSKKL